MRANPSMAGIETFVVEVHVIINPDGSVQSAQIDSSRDNGHPNWKLFAQDCLRAVLKSSPLKMPSNRPYEDWKTMTFVFHGYEMVNP